MAMDVKLSQPRTDAKPNAKQKSLFAFIQELKSELSKVSWTSKEELGFSTKIVVSSIFLFGLGIYLVDLLVKSGLDFVSFIARLIT